MSGQHTVGIVLFSHSAGLAAGAVELVSQIVGGAPFLVGVGGTDDGRLGTSSTKLERAIDQVSSGNGVVVIPDLGSAVLTARLHLAERASGDPVVLLDAPFVEGALAAAATVLGGADLDAVQRAVEQSRDARKL